MQTVHCSHHINIIISAWINKMLVCCHPTVINQLGLVDWREVCFAWPQPIDRFIYLFFLWHWHRWKNFSWISCYQTGFVRQHQTNNSLSFCDKLINIANNIFITNNILEVAYLNYDQFGGLLESYLGGSLLSETQCDISA